MSPSPKARRKTTGSASKRTSCCRVTPSACQARLRGTRARNEAAKSPSAQAAVARLELMGGPLRPPDRPRETRRSPGAFDGDLVAGELLDFDPRRLQPPASHGVSAEDEGLPRRQG